MALLPEPKPALDNTLDAILPPDAALQHVEETVDDPVAFFVNNPQSLSLAYGASSLKAVLDNKAALLCAIMASFGGLTFGYDQGVISVTLVMDHFLKLHKGLLTAILELGAMLDRSSRRPIFAQRALMIGSVWFVVGSILQTATYSYSQLIVGRLLGGVGIGLLSSTAPLYISEISPPHVRGALLVWEQIMIVIGVVIAYWLTFGTRYINSAVSWRLPFGLQLIPGVILFKRYDESLASLARLRNLPEHDPRVQAEHLNILAEVAVNKEAAALRHPSLQSGSRRRTPSLWKAFVKEAKEWQDAFSKRYIKRTMVGAGVAGFQQFTGINALIYYSQLLQCAYALASLGLDDNTSILMSGIMNTLQLVGCLPTIALLDQSGRRRLLLIGSTLLDLCHTAVAAIIGSCYTNWDAHRGAGWAGVALVFFFMLSYGATWGPVSWALPPEVFPSSMRAKGVAISVATLWFSNFIVGLITPPLNSAKPYAAFAFYACFALLSLVWVYFFVPETKGRSLEDMDAVFRDSTAQDESGRRSKILQTLLDARAIGSQGSAAV
ncbi:general substrate transporter [Schizophyllum amplum]|uniref:General substrate transporter n=1 Tax=Schizophyllum amplum TaxID=97359 RepID=A0A550C331_9AGAR|nr:general substrate transporter [Auriculariopsis ampla]